MNSKPLKHKKKIRKENITGQQKRYEALLAEFMDNGFTAKQARYLIKLLNDLIPLV